MAVARIGQAERACEAFKAAASLPNSAFSP